MSTTERYIKCDCGTHILNITEDVDFNVSNVIEDEVSFDGSTALIKEETVFFGTDKPIEEIRYCQTFYFAMFNYARPRKSWANKLRLIMKIIRTGEPFEDQLCMSPDNAKDLADFIYAKIDGVKDAYIELQNKTI